jgi:hypothetical protein
LFLVVLAAVAAVAFYDVPSNAATVNGVGISRSTFNADLNDISNDSVFQCYLSASLALRSENQSSLPAIGGAGVGRTVTTRFSAFWLSELVNDELVAQLAARKHLSVTASDLTAGRSDLVDTISGTLADIAQDSGQTGACAPDGSDVLASVPASFANRLVRAQTLGDLVLANAAGYGLSSSALASYFFAHSSTFDTLCVSAIETTSEATAASLRAQIEGGASFAQVAEANSTDSTSAAQGGAIGCFSPSDPDYSSVTADVGGLAVGQVSQPQADQSSYILLEVTSKMPSTFAESSSAVRQAVLAAGSTAANRELTGATKGAVVTIDPRYGTWTGGATIVIRPPASPPASALLSAPG